MERNSRDVLSHAGYSSVSRIVKQRIAFFFLAFALLLMSDAQVANAQASAADYYSVFVVVDPKNTSGGDWDRYSAPDPMILTVSPLGRRRWGRCNNAFQCTYSNVYVPAGVILRLEDHRDDDDGSADLFGEGPVRPDPARVTSVRLGAAVVTFTPVTIAAQQAAARAHGTCQCV